MKLCLSGFHRDIKKRVRKRLGGLPAQAIEARRLKRRRWFLSYSMDGYFLKILFVVLPTLCVFMVPIKPVGLMGVGFCALGFSFLQAWQLTARGLIPFEHQIPNLFPVSWVDYFRWCLGGFVKENLWILFGFLSVYLSLLYGHSLSFWGIMGAIFSAFLQWVVVVSVALLFVGRGFWLHLQKVGWGFFITGISVCYFGSWGFLQYLANPVLGILPTGWPTVFFLTGILSKGEGSWVFLPFPALLFLFTTILLAWSIPSSVRRLSLLAASFDEFKEEAQEDEVSEASLGSASLPSQAVSDQSAIAVKIRKGALAENVSWQNHGMIERIIHGWLSERDKQLLPLMLMDTVSWTRGWIHILFVFLVGAGVCLTISSNPTVGTIAAVAPLLLILGSTAGSWIGFVATPGYGMTVPGYANFPVGFWEASRLMLKIGMLHTLFFLPIIMGCSLLICGILEVGIGEAFFYGIKGFLALLAVQPFWVLTHFSGGTSDTRRFKTSCMVVPLCVGGVLAFVGGVIFVFLMPFPWFLAGSLGIMLVPLLVLRCYAWLYNRASFDLVQVFQQKVSSD